MDESDGRDPGHFPDGAPAPGPNGPFFAQGGVGDRLPPGPVLTGLTENAALDVARLSDDELIGVLQATRRQVAREQYKQVLVTAEFARRRQAAFTDAAYQDIPVRCRPGR